jgi:peptide-methionine (S)-S-oxide reductase
VAVGSRSSKVRAAFGAFSTGIYSYSTAVGFCAVYTKNPRYEEASSGRSGHFDAVRVAYDSSGAVIVPYRYVDVLRWFWESHDPCSIARLFIISRTNLDLGNARSVQHRSALYCFKDERHQLIEASREACQQALIQSVN